VLGGAGIPVRVVAQETSHAVVEVNNNTVTNVNGTEDTDIDVQSRFQTARADVTITNNTVSPEVTGVAGINLIVGSSTAGESNITCGDVANNNVPNAGAGVVRAFRVRNSDLSNTNRLYLEGFTTDTPTTWINRGNLPANAAEVAVSLTGTAVAPSGPPGGVCEAVDTPSDFGPVSFEANSSVDNPMPSLFVGLAANLKNGSTESEPVRATYEAAPAKLVLSSIDLPNSTVVAALTRTEQVPVSSPQTAEREPVASVAPARDLSTKSEAPVTRREAKLNHANSSRNRANSTAKATVVHAPAFNPGAGGTVNVTIGTLPAGDSVTITFQVVVDNPYSGGPNVSNQGTVSGSNFSNVLTDDPDVVGSNNPTLTPINSTDIRINDAKQTEPATGTSTMLFTVTLTQPAPGGGLTVNYASANGGGTPATGGASCSGSEDYVTTSGTATVAAGSMTTTIPVTICSDASAEPDETLLMNISSPTSGTIVDSQATGTITANTAGTFLISELRTSGPGGAGDDYVELYNNTNSPLTVAASDASAGYGLYKIGATCNDSPVLIGTIPNGTVIPARGHYLVVGSAYSLANYGGTGAAAGNLTMSSDIENDRNVAVFSTANVANISSANRLDAVGFGTNTGNVCDLLREGTNLGATAGSTTEHSFFRKECDFVTGVGCSTPGTPKDTNDNSVDFMFADTQGTFISGIPQRLGAPGPENLASPILRNTVVVNNLDNSVASSAVPNRVRSFTSDPGNNSTFGTLKLRRRVFNNTGGNVTRLRFRVVEMTTFPSPGGGVADLRLRTSLNEVSVGPVNDATTCTASGAGTPPCSVNVSGLTLESPPSQPNGGGFNSTVSAGTITLGTPLANGASLNVNFLLGIQTTGTFRFLVIVEALP
jgi:hypothetical protein